MHIFYSAGRWRRRFRVSRGKPHVRTYTRADCSVFKPGDPSSTPKNSSMRLRACNRRRRPRSDEGRKSGNTECRGGDDGAGGSTPWVSSHDLAAGPRALFFLYRAYTRYNAATVAKLSFVDWLRGKKLAGIDGKGITKRARKIYAIGSICANWLEFQLSNFFQGAHE